MAGIQLHGTQDEIALVAATAKTILQIVAASNHRVLLKEWSVAFDGTSSGNEPVLVELIRQSDAGTSSVLTPIAVDESTDETLQTAMRHSATVEPTGTTVIFKTKVHPQDGMHIIYPLGGDVLIKGGTRLGIRCTAADAVNVVPYVRCEE